MATKEAIAKAMALLSMEYREAVQSWTSDQTTAQINLWERMLTDIGDDLLMAAVVDHIRAAKWWPKISEIVSRAHGLTDRADKNNLTAESAWLEVVREMRRVGWCGDPDFSAQIVYDVVNGFGWEYLCGLEDHGTIRAHFYRTFAALQEERKHEKHLLPEIRKRLELAGSTQARIMSGGVQP